MIGINNLKIESLVCPDSEGKDRGHKPRNTGKGVEMVSSSPSLQEGNQNKQMLIFCNA